MNLLKPPYLVRLVGGGFGEDAIVVNCQERRTVSRWSDAIEGFFGFELYAAEAVNGGKEIFGLREVYVSVVVKGSKV